MVSRFFSTLYSSLLRLYSNFYDSSNVWLQHYWFKYLCFISYNYLMNILFNFINFLIFTWKILSNSVFLFIKHVLAILFILILSISLYFLVKFLDNNFGFSLMEPLHTIYLDSNTCENPEKNSPIKDSTLAEKIVPKLFNEVGLPVNNFFDQLHDDLYIRLLRSLRFSNKDIREFLIKESPEEANLRRTRSHSLILEREHTLYVEWRNKVLYGVFVFIFFFFTIFQSALFWYQELKLRKVLNV